MDNLDIIKKLLFDKVEDFCSTKGITLKSKDLIKCITITRQEVEKGSVSKPVRKLIIKPKTKQKLLLKPKAKQKLLLKPKTKLVGTSDYVKFVNICKDNDLIFFQFYDECNWVGPAIKIDAENGVNVFDYFKSLTITTITGTNFYLIHPKVNMKDATLYPKTNNDCKLEDRSLIVPTSDDENSICDNTTDDEIELDEWKHEATNTKYLIDPNTNILYCFHSAEPIGKKIDNFTIEFN